MVVFHSKSGQRELATATYRCTHFELALLTSPKFGQCEPAKWFAAACMWWQFRSEFGQREFATRPAAAHIRSLGIYFIVYFLGSICASD